MSGQYSPRVHHVREFPTYLGRYCTLETLDHSSELNDHTWVGEEVAVEVALRDH